jgi:hypothetical protein
MHQVNVLDIAKQAQETYHLQTSLPPQGTIPLPTHHHPPELLCLPTKHLKSKERGSGSGDPANEHLRSP